MEHRFPLGREKNKIEAEIGTRLEKHQHLRSIGIFCTRLLRLCVAYKRFIIAVVPFEI